MHCLPQHKFRGLNRQTLNALRIKGDRQRAVSLLGSRGFGGRGQGDYSFCTSYRTVPRFLYQRRMFFNDLTVRGTSLVPGSTLRENNSVTLEHQACDVAKRFKVSRFQVAGPAPSFFPSFSSLCQSLGLVHVMNRATFQFVPDTVFVLLWSELYKHLYCYSWASTNCTRR